MTNDEKVRKMFEIRKAERPDLADSAERVEKILLDRHYTAYDALLKMYKKRYEGKK